MSVKRSSPFSRSLSPVAEPSQSEINENTRAYATGEGWKAQRSREDESPRGLEKDPRSPNARVYETDER
jgi:hypothetical protein